MDGQAVEEQGMDEQGHLTDGWEPGLAAEDSVLRSFVLGQAAHAAYVAQCTGGRAARWDDVAAADPGSAIFFDNMAVLLRPPLGDALGDVLTRLAAFYPPGRHVSLLSAWPLPQPPAGWELMGHPPLMLRPAGGTAPPVPPGLEVVRVGDAVTLAEFVATLLGAFDVQATEGLPLADPRILDGPFQLFLGLLDGRPVATAGARLGHGLVDVEWVGCLPDARGRGIGAAVTWAATLAEPGSPAVLIASDDGQPVYERMGYLRLMRMTMWHCPPAI